MAHTGVNSGGLNMNSGGEDLELGENEYGYTADENVAPEELIGLPGVFTDHDVANQADEDEDSDSDSDDGAIPPEEKINAAVSAGNATSVVSMNKDDLVVDGGSLRALGGEFSSTQALVSADSSTLNRNEGEDPVSGYRWGRWDQGFATVEGGSSFSRASQGLHYVVETQPDPPHGILAHHWHRGIHPGGQHRSHRQPR